jgi:uncharacterized protein YgiB involved in biofilm formation
MKRSRKVSLVLMSASVVTLTACGEDEVPVDAYRTVDSCIAEGKFSEQYCRGEWEKAEQAHLESAPRYTNRADCEADYGFQQCQAAQSSGGGGGFFMPFMAGYLMGQLVEGASNRRFASQPFYRSNYSNGFTTLGNQPVYRSGNKIVTSPQAAAGNFKPAQVRTKTVARSGFGKRSTSSGWGS